MQSTVRATVSGPIDAVWEVTADQRLPLVEKALTRVLAAGLLNGLVRAVKKAR